MVEMTRKRIEREHANFTDQVMAFVLTCQCKDFARLTVSGMARQFNMDRTRLARIFKKISGLTLESFLKQERMHRSRDLLVNDEDLSVKEIAQIMGFCNSDYFTQVFKRFYGISPHKYREYRTQRSPSDRRHRIHDRRVHRQPVPKIKERRRHRRDRRQGADDRRSNARNKWIVLKRGQG